MPVERSCLVLRLAAPMQAWGKQSDFNRRETNSYPSKSGVIGLLAAADGRRREDSIVDLVNLRFGIRVDQEGSLLRDYHTVSDYRGLTLPNAEVGKKGEQKRTKYPTKETYRYYIQDAVFVAALEGPVPLLEGLAAAIARPGFPLALGRRSCPPTQPIYLRPTEGELVLWAGSVDDVLSRVTWQASKPYRSRIARSSKNQPTIRLFTAVDDKNGLERARDLPRTFAHRDRSYSVRRVRHDWVSIPTGFTELNGPKLAGLHDPFALLGW